MVFDTWYDVVRVLIVGVLAYISLVVVVRVSGKRTLAKMNAFDLVVTVSLGSVLATVAVSSDVALTDGVAAFAVLCGAQFVVAWTSSRTDVARRMVKARPVLVLERGELLIPVLRRERLTEGEVRQAIRSSGNGAVEDVAAVVLETDGTLSVILRSALGSGTSLDDVMPGEARTAA